MQKVLVLKYERKMLINREYFVGELYIEGAAGNSTTAALIQKQVQSIIDRREEEYLKDFLGEIYQPFMEYIDGDLDEDSPYFKLYESLTGENSPILYYVYFYYIRYVNSSVTPNGVRKDRANAFTPNNKLVSAWNTMADLNREIDQYLTKEFPKYRSNKYMLMHTNSLL